MSVLNCQMPMLPTVMYSSDADCLKNDFQTAVRRNLHSWVKWRTKLNENLVDAVMSGNQLDNVEPLRQFLVGDSPDPDHPTSHPRTLLTFSAASNSTTNLHTKEFFKYGIPRAKLDPRLESARRSCSSYDDDQLDNLAPAVDQDPQSHPDASEVFSTDVGRGDHETEDLKLDYFYQNESEAAALVASAKSTLIPRRFHRSAATLPTTPDADDNDVSSVGERQSRFSRKSEQRRHQPPSYVEPFVRPRHGFITARRDNELYTRSAGYLDEL